MTEANYCEKFSAGERIPSWILETEPFGPGPELVLSFNIDCYVLTVPNRVWIVPAGEASGFGQPVIRIEAFWQGQLLTGPVHVNMKWIAETEVAIPQGFTILGRDGPNDKGPPPIVPMPIGPMKLEPVK